MKIKIEDFFKEIETNGGTYKIKTPSGYKLIGNLFKKIKKGSFRIKLSNRIELSGSKDHMVEVPANSLNNLVEELNNSFWITLKNILKGDLVYYEDGNYHEVIEKEFIGYHDTFDLEVLDEERKYLTNGVSSHNCGKTAIIEGLAMKIYMGECPRSLENKRLVSLDMASIVAGTKYRGQFEERLKIIIEELQSNPDIIVFIDEIHNIVGAGNSSGSLDASNMFKPALSRGEIQCIGATTLDEYRTNIEKDGALERRFQKVMVDPPTKEETLEILKNSKDRYESFHRVNYTDEVLELCVNLADRYITDREFPDKAFDILDEVGARSQVDIESPKIIEDLKIAAHDVKYEKLSVVKKQDYEKAAELRDKEKKIIDKLSEEKKKFEQELLTKRRNVTIDMVYDVVSNMTKIPMTKLTVNDIANLVNLEDKLKEKVIGQDKAVSLIAKAIQRSKVGLNDPKKPTFVGLMIGNTGVGKTQLAKQLAVELFGSDDSLIKLDMSEYSDKMSVNKLIGSSSGYVGYDEGSAFLNKIKNKPYSVILFDEIEKAHPDIFNTLLQLFDEGILTDNKGKKINFKNCIILMTSNVGTRVLKDFGTGVGFATKNKEDNKGENAKQVLEKELGRAFSPEFINRIDDIIYFNDLNDADISKISEIEVSKLNERILNIGFKIKIDKKLTEYLIKNSNNERFGGRLVKRMIQKWVEDYITDYIIKNNPEKGSTLQITYNEKENISVVSMRKKKS